MAKDSPNTTVDGLNLNETELTLGLPGEIRYQTAGKKRGFSETVDLNLGGSSSVVETTGRGCEDNQSEDEISNEATEPPRAKAQLVGWPPVRSFRKSMMKPCKYVKVAVDELHYLRKVDLEIYSSYQQLMSALEDMFTCLTIRNDLNKRKLMDTVNGLEYEPTYEDKDGDWMLVGDVPWKMFVESCKRLRLRRSSEATGLGPKNLPQCSSTSG